MLFAAAAVGFSLVASGGLAEDVKFEGGTTNWVDGDLVITYTGNGTLSLPKTASARILAVGGGGGGGRVTYTSGTRGGGGGGGGGGVVITNGVALYGDYTIAVGAGGAAGEGGTNVSNPGGNGGDTSFMQNGVAVIDVARGGGGGGAESKGGDGGCGGGGSLSPTLSSAPGGIGSQGSDGGADSIKLGGGGGGGAGATGASPTSLSSGAKGGDGRKCDITGDSDACYGGGGGGGNASNAMNTKGKSGGGLGGGGAGGGGRYASSFDAGGNGVDGLGGGGGGGGAYAGAVAGKGGSGVLIVRITAYSDSGVVPPTVRSGFVFNGEEQSAIDPDDPNRAFYTVEGPDTATDAGDYSFTVKLREEGYVWSDGTTAPKSYDWSIARKVVSVPVAREGLVYDGTEQVGLTNAVPEDVAFYDVTDGSAVNAGDYAFTATLKYDKKNVKWSDGKTDISITRDWEIAKAENSIKGLSIADWQAGVSAKKPSVSGVTFGSVGDIVYEYREESASTWGTMPPTAAGRYVVRATLAASGNWEAATASTAFYVWRHPSADYTYYVDVTNAVSSGATDVTVSEANLPGFLYDRTDGLKDNAFRFVYSPTADSLDDLLLPYSNLTWNVSGESTMRVRLPSGMATPGVIRMYWHAGENEPMSANDAGAASLAAGSDATGYGLVNSNGVWLNYWTAEPTLSKTAWDEGETAGELTKGELKVGSVKVTYRKLTGDTEASDEMPTARGSYVAVLTMDGLGTDYALLGGERRLAFEILGHAPVSSVGGTAGGRILLVNDDTGGDGREAITDQGYWQTAASGRSIFWTHEGTHSSINIPFAKAGSRHALYYVRPISEDKAETNVLWRIVNGMIGNIFRANSRGNASANYLPWSSTSRAMSGDSALPADTIYNGMRGNSEVANIILRNVAIEDAANDGAAVYSPCYTDGIGTIYFDAVNGWNGDAENFKLVVEVATETTDELAPTDENSAGVDREGEEDPYWKLRGKWKPVSILPLVKNGTGEFVAQERRDELDLLGFSGGGGTDKFVRGIATVDIRKPVRFRIRRTTFAKYSQGAKFGDDAHQGLLLLDNIIASAPAMYTDLRPIGYYDETKMGKQTLGQECAFSVPFPSVSDTAVYARAEATDVITPGVEIANSNFVASARLNYRWRYLNQRFSPAKGENGEDRWKTVFLDPDNGYRSVEPLSFPNAEGDIEFFYDLTLQAPFYSYRDYSGCGVAKPTGDYTEEKRAWTNRMDLSGLSSTRLASGGTNWFVRLRRGASNWASMRVVLEGGGADGIAGDYDMELISDNTWRALVLVPTNASETVRFHFEGFNELEAGATAIPTNPTAVAWGVALAATNAVPATGKLVRGGTNDGWVTPDHVANYLEFKLNDRFETYAITRAEYQDFNHWNDAARDKTFKINYVETNSVDYAAMQTYVSDFSTWDLYVSTNKNWNETFYIPDYTDPGYPKDRLYQRATTPKDWAAQNVSWVYENLVESNKYLNSTLGLAAKLLGQGGGVLDFTSSETPSGLGHVQFRTRLGQSMTFDSFSIRKDAMMSDNYLFHAPLVMSRGCEMAGTKVGDMAVGASVSLVAYYDLDYGCYEFRISRPYAGKSLLLELYKWTFGSGNNSTSSRLCHTYVSSSAWLKDGTDSEVAGKYYGAFISCGDGDGGTEIICGLSADPQTLTSTQPVTQFSEKKHFGLIYTDDDSPYLGGAYGVGAKDCPAQFVLPSHTEAVLADAPNVRSAADGKTTFAFETDVNLSVNTYILDQPYLAKRNWSKIPGRTEFFTNTVGVTTLHLLGLRTPIDLTQNLEVWLSPKGRGRWERFGSVPVSGFAFSDVQTVPIHRTGTFDLRLKTGDDSAVDVVVDDIIQHQWQAPNIEDGKYNDQNGFIYTQGVVTQMTGSARAVVLQPSRALVTAPVSLRSPLLAGLGKFAFTYRDVNTNAEVWVQIATNDVSRSMGSYNTSLAEGEGAGQWLTIRKYGPASAGYEGDNVLETGGTGTKVIYLGWHNNDDRPVEGVFRLLIPTNVVNEAIARATVTNSTPDLDYGRITVTGMTVTDEPGLSERSWRGWNMRTVGDETDSERRMYLADMTQTDGEGYGLVCGLNNGVWPDDLETDDDEARVVSGYPAVYSPTFKSEDGVKRGIGSVTYRARLYDDSALTAGGGQVVGYGSTDPLYGKWVPIFTNAVTSPVFSDFSWSAGNESYYAVKLEITGASLDSKVSSANAPVDRVILDEVFVGEKVQPTLAFVYARPFRNDLMSATPIADILSANEQPLAGEGWGVQAQLTLQQLADEVDLSRGMKVSLSYYSGETPWGYDNWKDLASATKDVELTQVGEPTNLVFRSVGTTPTELVPPAPRAGTVVQYMLKVSYYDRGGRAYESLMSSWTQPTWYYPIDKNGTGSGGYDSEDFSKYSAYTILDSVSPGRAWINEVNWNDGPEAETGGVRCETNQFIEICVPSGADMSGWRVRVRDGNNGEHYLARFGETVPATTVTPNAVSGYEFVVLQSPKTRDAGGITNWTGLASGEVSLGTWSSSVFSEGSLIYDLPYQFELIRPSGVIEHQFVLSGTNEWASWAFGYIYDGTNLVAKLNAEDSSPLRFYAGDELARRTNGELFGSAGVTGGTAAGDPAPGAATTWKSGLAFTPGKINEGQVIPEGWVVHPNGTNAWVYLSIVGEHLTQEIGGSTNRSAVVIVPQGGSTNVTYTAEPWYELASLTENGVTTAANKPGTWMRTLSPTGQTLTVVAREGPDSRLATKYDLCDDNAYTPAVLNWLRSNWPDKTADDIRLAYYRGLSATAETLDLDLTQMYWLDIPPITDSGEREWWLRGDMANIKGEPHVIERNYGGTAHYLTNRIVDVTLYISNAVKEVSADTVYAPKRLQGVGNERSDEFTGGVWTSVTFKVRAALDVNGMGEDGSKNKGYLPFRAFTFGPGSFDDKFSARIEIDDPFSTVSPGYGYGWSNYPNTTNTFFKWTLDTDLVPLAIPVLKADDTYETK